MGHAVSTVDPGCGNEVTRCRTRRGGSMRKGDIEKMVAGAITVVQLLPELNAGGVERGTLEMADYLSFRGHRSVVVSAGGRLVPALEKGGSRHLPWPIGAKSPATVRYVLSLRRFLKENSVHILHARSRMPAWIGYLAWKSLPAARRPRFVTTFHGYYSVNRYSAVMTKGERVIAVSKGIESHIREHYKIPQDQIVLVYRGIDTRIFDPANVTPDRIRKLIRLWRLKTISEPMIMLPARMTRLKGQDVFIKSLARIKSLPWQALLVGDIHESGSYVSDLCGLIRQEGLEQRIRLVGHCEDMPAAFMLADIVVSAASTHPESFGRVAVEAQAMGKPVIASAQGGSLETVRDGETGWLVMPKDAVGLAEALEKTIKDKDMRIRFGLRGRVWVMKQFTLDRMCRKTVELYLYLLDRSSCAAE